MSKRRPALRSSSAGQIFLFAPVVQHIHHLRFTLRHYNLRGCAVFEFDIDRQDTNAEFVMLRVQPLPFSGCGTTPSRASAFHVPTTG